jgi:predicted alpha/beta superfamily hydrolase
VQIKPTLGEDKVSVGGAYRLAPGSTVDIYPFFGAPFGKVTIVKDFASPQLKNSRALRIWLPPSYAENPAKRYPVLYMHDGQNLFDAKTAAYGVEWGIDETINRLVAAGAVDEVIVVGIDNTPDRIPEYTPCCDPKYGGGRLDAYGAFIVDTVKPFIDRSYRTLPGKDTTAIMGSSLGGIASVAIAQRYPDIFSKAGGVSSSFWWNQGALISKLPARVPVKFYLDAGTTDDGLEDTTKMRDAMLAKGYRESEDLLFFKAEGGRHNEASWAARVEKPLMWFFPWGSSKQ